MALRTSRSASSNRPALSGPVDNHYVNMLEQKLENTRMKRVDSETIDKLIDKDEKQEAVLSKDEIEKLKGIYEKAILKESAALHVESLSPDELPVTITLPEFMRRMKDMAALGGGMGMMGNMPEQLNVTVNANHPLSSKIIKAKKEERRIDLAKQAYDLALLSQNMLEGTDLTNFIERSVHLASN